jgi:hypothetical protein
MSKYKNMKTNNKREIDLEKEIMSKVISGKISMKPRWYFVLGTTLSILGLALLSVVSIFLVNVMIFSLRTHGPMGEWRLQMMLDSFPFWMPIFAILGVVVGVFILKKYDFSYKKNFFAIIIGFIFSIIIAGFLIDLLGLNDIWARRGGVMRQLYQQDNRSGGYNKNGIKNVR